MKMQVCQEYQKMQKMPTMNRPLPLYKIGFRVRSIIPTAGVEFIKDNVSLFKFYGLSDCLVRVDGQLIFDGPIANVQQLKTILKESIEFRFG